MKAQSSNKDLEGCTFAPKINKRPSTVKHNPETRGVNKFLERQRQAKERKYETETPKKPKIDDLSHNDYERALRELHEELHTIT